MPAMSWTETPIAPFGMKIDADLSAALSDNFVARMIELFDMHKLLVFRGQQFDEDRQVEILSHFGKVLGSHGEYRRISSDGALGSGPLTWHSDLAFTEEPFKIISLLAVNVNPAESWTAFTNGVDVARMLPEDLRNKIADREAMTVISAVQSHRDVDYDTSDEMPNAVRPLLIENPRTGEELLYINHMQTSRIMGMERGESDATLARLFDELYRQDRVYTHRWSNGDFVIWDNIACQHSRGDLTGMMPRELQRVCVADKSFFDLLPQFKVGDERISDWGSGDKALVLD